jgi:hypothetical protein
MYARIVKEQRLMNLAEGGFDEVFNFVEVQL